MTMTDKASRQIASSILYCCIADSRLIKKHKSNYIPGIDMSRKSLAQDLKEFVVGDDAHECQFYCDALEIPYAEFARECGFDIKDYPELFYLTI